MPSRASLCGPRLPGGPVPKYGWSDDFPIKAIVSTEGGGAPPFLCSSSKSALVTSATLNSDLLAISVDAMLEYSLSKIEYQHVRDIFVRERNSDCFEFPGKIRDAADVHLYRPIDVVLEIIELAL